MKLFKCTKCDTLVETLCDCESPLVCCGETMVELIPCTTDADVEKHVPVVKVEDCKVYVDIGKEPHPMDKEHYIEWIAVDTDKGMHKRCLKPGDKPRAKFRLSKNEKPVFAYAYCNIHGFWAAKC